MPVCAPLCDFGWKAPDFELTDTFGTIRTLESLRAPNGFLLMFICNHCPYVKAILDRLCGDVADVKAMGIGVAAIMSNDTHAYPEDSFPNMQRIAKELNFPFPYLYDPTQQIARAYGAACTPDFFGFNRKLELQYRGRLDSDAMAPATPHRQRELVEAMRSIAASGRGPEDQTAGMGCSIKWRN